MSIYRDSRPIEAIVALVLVRILRFAPEIKSEEDLLPPGAAPGTIPTDLEQATGLERLEILGKMQGIDIFDMRPLDASRKGNTRLAVAISQHLTSNASALARKSRMGLRTQIYTLDKRSCGSINALFSLYCLYGCAWGPLGIVMFS